ncbi:hypothetical protein GCM10011581_19490 [Saccharopolyspora subtropica]|uniref:Acyltransferase 3 domain-containing protein n=1 Tax=Saccharopolyspora thermophila TaxID=89367 RepID=A0A917JU44_9PSEU|nr:hypothetical protein GCM10011581_19490 [Saccharopolyspora subtropica]
MIWVGDARVVHTRPEWFAEPHHGFAWIRMIGAMLVIYGHSSPLVGTGELFPPEWPVQPDEGVLMGFFAMSGFQITESWMRDPHPARFAAKRVLRLWPPMLTVSLGMALIVGPMVTKLSVGDYFAAHGTWGYIVNNAGLLTLKHELPGVFEDNPWPNAVNGSLWTLPMELLAYGGLFVLLLLGAGKQKYRWLTVVALVGLVVWDRHLEQLPGAESAGSFLSVPIESLVAFLVAFAFGVVLNLYRIPLSPLAAGAGIAVLALMPNSIAASFLMTFVVSYAVVVAGHFWPARLTVPGLWVNGSYGVYVWGFPIQQLLAMAGIGNQWLMLLCAAPLAYVMGTLSWKFIEEPTMRLRHYVTPAPKKQEEPEENLDEPDDVDDLDELDEPDDARREPDAEETTVLPAVGRSPRRPAEPGPTEDQRPPARPARRPRPGPASDQSRETTVKRVRPDRRTTSSADAEARRSEPTRVRPRPPATADAEPRRRGAERKLTGDLDRLASGGTRHASTPSARIRPERPVASDERRRRGAETTAWVDPERLAASGGSRRPGAETRVRPEAPAASVPDADTARRPATPPSGMPKKRPGAPDNGTRRDGPADRGDGARVNSVTQEQPGSRLTGRAPLPPARHRAVDLPPGRRAAPVPEDRAAPVPEDSVLAKRLSRDLDGSRPPARRAGGRHARPEPPVPEEDTRPAQRRPSGLDRP